MKFHKTSGKSMLEVSEMIRDHLTAQKAQSTTYADGCAYRGDNGTSCAVGCLMTDDEYRPEFEGKGVMAFPISNAFALTGDDIDFLRDWQFYHDGHNYREWIRYGMECHSPEAAHQTIMSRFNQEG